MSQSAPDLPPEAVEPVLSTLNKDGSRRWLRPRLSSGRFLNARRAVGYLLMLLFTALPYTKINGKPAMLFDIPRREFTLFGATFLPTDTLLLALLLLAIFIGIFLMTALFGRIWCGWGCPQTVYMELLYRPIERLLEGPRYRSGGKASIHPLRQIGKYAAFLVVSVYLAHTFLAYFVGVDRLAQWVRQSPFEHPTAFLVMAGTTALMMFDFCYFREQVCTLMCPYGRFQSVLLDRKSLIISYDPRRGEPRGRMTRREKEGERTKGDCIDCGLCVVTCPTGIDIRTGLQMECIGCAQCIDACDAVMAKIKRPLGLIRYSSQEAIETGNSRLLRPRVIIYPVVLAVVLGLFGYNLAGRQTAEVSFLRNRNMTYRVLDSGAVSNILQVKIVNRTDAPRTYDVTVVGESEVMSSDLPLRLAAGQARSATLHVVLPRDRFERGRAELTVRVTDDDDFVGEYRQHVLGPLFGGGSAQGTDP